MRIKVGLMIFFYLCENRIYDTKNESNNNNDLSRFAVAFS